MKCLTVKKEQIKLCEDKNRLNLEQQQQKKTRMSVKYKLKVHSWCECFCCGEGEGPLGSEMRPDEHVTQHQ